MPWIGLEYERRRKNVDESRGPRCALMCVHVRELKKREFEGRGKNNPD